MPVFFECEIWNALRLKIQACLSKMFGVWVIFSIIKTFIVILIYVEKELG
jgi:hypothetical protein